MQTRFLTREVARTPLFNVFRGRLMKENKGKDPLNETEKTNETFGENDRTFEQKEAMTANKLTEPDSPADPPQVEPCKYKNVLPETALEFRNDLRKFVDKHDFSERELDFADRLLIYMSEGLFRKFSPILVKIQFIIEHARMGYRYRPYFKICRDEFKSIVRNKKDTTCGMRVFFEYVSMRLDEFMK